MFVVQSIKEALREINDNQRKQEETSENALEELVELFNSVTAQLRDSDQATANQGLCSELLAEDIPMLLIDHVILKKWNTATRLIVALLDFKMNDQHPAKQYFSSNFAVILEKILHGVETLSMADCALGILIACVKHKEMAVAMLNLEVIHRLVQIMMADTKFSPDAASSAQWILRELLLEHKDVAAEFVLRNVETFFDINFYLMGGGFVVRESTKLFWNMLYDPAYKQVMLKFVSDQPQTYAAWTIELLYEVRRRGVKGELWQLFKLFVAYPAKSPALKKLLIHHRKKLIKYARQIIREKDRDDPEADEENFYVIKSLEELTED